MLKLIHSGWAIEGRTEVIAEKRSPYDWLLLIVTLGSVSLYFLTNRYASLRSQGWAWVTTRAWDRWIPLWPGALPVYYSLFIVGLGTLFWFWYKKQGAFRLMAFSVISDAIISNAIFLFSPTRVLRPDVVTSNFWFQWLQWTYHYDQPFNSLPSLHVSLSLISGWVWWRVVSHSWAKAVAAAWTLAVMASTLLVKQHAILDVIAGMAIGLLSIWIAARLVTRSEEGNLFGEE